MARICSVCAHAERPAIDAALAAGQSCSTLAARYCTLGRMALERHKAAHLPASLVKAQEAVDVRHALDVVKQLQAINGATLQILADARRSGDADTALKAIDRIQRQIELQAKLLGELDDRPQVNVLVTAEWHALRHAILAALAPFQEARAAVAAALARLDGTIA